MSPSPHLLSLASPSPPSSPTNSLYFPQRTNTIAITSIPKPFFQPAVLTVLKAHFESFGDINQWVPLPGFGRIIVVYYLEEHAEDAKLQCDPIVLEGEAYGQSPVRLRVYRADPNPLIEPDAFSHVPAANYLRPPVQDKNFLISPPGSPPVGWEPVQEDPPNSCPLADDLVAALEKLQTKERGSGLEILLDPMEGSGVGVYVEDCDMDEGDAEIPDDEWIYGETAPARDKWRSFATAMPPIRVSA
ncbi:Calcipressin [Pluteus cervinus]|uniref:Calcipressin n=1 Tax=Pluteus cervinus TaxID=181527 RepID=A0ACD3AF18_9AGAR|nr:Calcipressin [Pluteus cervinus]